MKNFTKQNFKTNPLWIRLLIMTFMLLAGVSTAWAYNQSAVDLYFDNSEAQWDNCRVYIGHNKWLAFYNMSRVSGTEHLWKLSSNFNSGNSWNDATHWGFTSDYWDAKEQSVTKIVHTGDKKFTYDNTSTVDENAWTNDKIYKTNGTANVTLDNQTKKAYKITSSTKSNYTVTINSATGGTLTVKDYDNNAVSSGASKIKLTVLKFSASASTGYTFEEVQINNGSSTTTISAANLTSQTYTIKSNVTITPVWKKDCTPPAEPTLTNPDPQCGGFITLPASAEGVNLKWYDAQTGGNVVSDTEITTTGTYWAAAVTECESTSRTAYTVTINPIPEVNSLLSTLNICIGSIDETDLTTLSHVEVSSGSTAVWYTSKDGVEQAERANLINGGTYWVAAENSTTGCKSTTRTSFTIYINDLPQRPSLGKDEYETCAHASNTVNLDELAGTNNVVWYIGETEVDDPGQISLATAGTFIYTAKAMNQEGCQSATGAEFELTVKPLPTITGISVNNSTPVINEDVLLTVEGGDIARVEWSITSGKNASLSDASGNSVKLTSTASGAVTVTATAISANGCETTLTKEVTFIEEEDCTPIISKDIQITFYHPSTYNEYNSQKGQWWGMGTMYYSTDKKSWLTKDMGEATSGSKTVTIQNITSEKLYVYFESKWTYHVSYKASTKEDIEELTRGNRYDIRITSHGNDNEKATSEATCTGSLSTPVPLSAPAVKTVSATSEEGSGVVNFTGQIIKTGCAAKSSIYYGYQFKKVDEVWPTSGIEASNTPEAGKLIPCTNASATALNYQFSANVEGLDDGNYHFRAYIINGYNFTNGDYDQGVYYGLDKLVTVSTVKKPVTTAEIKLVNQDGTSVELGHKYCIGATAYIEVDSDDVKYTTATWKSDLGVEVEQIGKTNIYQFEVKGKDQIVVLLSNKHNTEPASSAPLEVEVYASPSVPEIALGESSICNTNVDGTTLTVTRTKSGQYYALYKEDGNGGIEVEDYQLCTSDNAEIKYTGLKEAAKYFVKTYRGECDSEITRSSSATLTVVDSEDVKISIEPTATETTPWMPVKLTVTATSDYTVTSDPNDAVIDISGNIVKVKLPLPTEGVQNKGTTEDNVNVTFTDVPYTITAELKTAGEEGNTCAQPAIANITLKPYIEICD